MLRAIWYYLRLVRMLTKEIWDVVGNLVDGLQIRINSKMLIDRDVCGRTPVKRYMYAPQSVFDPCIDRRGYRATGRLRL